MSNYNIVVAYYNNKKFLGLIDSFEKNIKNKYNFIVYNKSGNELKHNKENLIQKYLPNVGHESDTYLNHIIDNYDNLSEYTIFIQDDTNNHIPDHNKFISFCNDIIQNKQLFALYPATWRGGKGVHIRAIGNGHLGLGTLPSRDAIKKCCEEHNIYLPKRYTTETCAHFICHKNSILKHEKNFYIELRKWLLSGGKRGFVLEHMWKIIFSDMSVF